MCNCFVDAIKIISKKHTEWDGKKVKQFSFSNAGINLRTGQSFVGLGIDIQYENQKKMGHTTLTMAYCPLCGKSLKEEKK